MVSRSSIFPLPSLIRVRISSIRLPPTRQGTHLPQDSAVAKFRKNLREFDHAGVFIDDDHAARAHDRAGLLERVEVDLDVEVLGGQAAAQRPAGLHGLEFLALGDAAADVEDDLAQGDAHGHFDQAGVVHLAGQGEDGRARDSFACRCC